MPHTCDALCTVALHRREDPSIFGFNLMNEPRSQSQLYVVKRTTTDGSREYNISYNPADDLQTWIEDMASYIKSIDPIHLLSTGARSGSLCCSPTGLALLRWCAVSCCFRFMLQESGQPLLGSRDAVLLVD